MIKRRLLSLAAALGLFFATLAPSAGEAFELTLLNGWQEYGFETGAPEAFVDGGIVYLKGAIAEGTSAPAFVLPVDGGYTIR